MVKDNCGNYGIGKSSEVSVEAAGKLYLCPDDVTTVTGGTLTWILDPDDNEYWVSINFADGHATWTTCQVNLKTVSDGEKMVRIANYLSGEGRYHYNCSYVPGTYNSTYDGVVYKIDAGYDCFYTSASTCFAKGTLVNTPMGLRKIEEIKRGDMVWTVNLNTGKKELQSVIDTSINISNKLLRIHIGGKIITVTEKHPFYVEKKGWVYSDELVEGDEVYSANSSRCGAQVEKIEFLNESDYVYNLHVENNHNYLITDLELLVHNAPAC